MCLWFCKSVVYAVALKRLLQLQQLRAASENRPFFEPLTAASDGDSKSDSKLPVQLHMDGEAGDLMRNAGKGEMKCSVERKTAVQIIASEPKMLMTPYGNITTDPRLIHMTGEKMVITCGSNPKRDKKSKNILTAIKIEPKSIGDKERLEPRKKRSADKSEPKTKKECACDCSC
ncbi:uncharacterized protein B4U80_02888 [Leptotrombidium deliense]|uniref:Uncharacterized protein n=1 Tax=Leptotrombidium deliense TaxID=299467 RepID=A0A443SLI5_9ACAR|nr:uncharacterized protein B4U80_02888 [Leptotrombidium deliense]